MSLSTFSPFRGIDVRSAPIADLQQCLQELFVGLRIAAPAIAAGAKFYRVRIVGDRIPKSIAELVPNIIDVGMPPKDRITRPGRLNDIGEQVGYFSDSRRFAYFEMSPKVGDVVILSRWISTCALSLLHIGYTDEALKKLGSARNPDEIAWAEATRCLDTRNWDVYGYISSEITKRVNSGDEAAYKTTIAMAKWFFGQGEHDGLIYPTIAMCGNANNVALKPDRVSKLRLTSVDFNRVTRVEGMNADLDLIDSAVQWDDAGAIKWNGRRIKWEIGPGEEFTWADIDGENVAVNPVGVEFPRC